MIHRIKSLIKEFEIGIGEFFIVFFYLVILGKFFNFMQSDIAFIEEVFSIAAVIYLFYIVGITKIIFGYRERRIDKLIIVFYFFFASLLLIYSSQAAIAKSWFLASTYNYLNVHKEAISSLFLHMGFFGLIFLSLAKAVRFVVAKDCLLHITKSYLPFLFENTYIESHPNKFLKTALLFIRFLLRAILIFLVLMIFYHLVFRIVAEWIAITMEEIIAVIFTIYLFTKYYRKLRVKFQKHIKIYHRFHPQRIIYWIGEMGDSFYIRFITFFQHKHTASLCIAGLLILHGLNGIAVFIVHYLYPRFIPLYIELLGEAGHESFRYLLAQDMAIVSGITGLSISYLYILNIIAIISFLAIPAFVWFRIFKGREFHIPRGIISLLFASFTAYILVPLFKFKPIVEKDVVGTDIVSKTIFSSWSLLDNFFTKTEVINLTLLISLAIGIAAYFLYSNKEIKKALHISIIVFASIFFAIYVVTYLISQFIYYSKTAYMLSLFLRQGFAYLAIYLTFSVITIFFYIFGLWFYINESFMEHKHKKWSNPMEAEIKHILRKARRFEQHLIHQENIPKP